MNRILVLGTLVALCSIAAGLMPCIPDEERDDCYPEPGSNEGGCIARNCTWCPTAGPNIPWCFFPGPATGSPGYRIDGEPLETENGFILNLVLLPGTQQFTRAIENLKFEVENQADYRLRITIKDVVPRFEVPIQVDPPQGGNVNPLYQVEYVSEPVFSFKIIRKSSGAVLFDSSLGVLIFEDQFIEFSTSLPSKNLYGIGENEQPTFRHNFDWNERPTTWALYAAGPAPSYDTNLYSVQPYYTVLENDGNTHSVVIVNSNAQQFRIFDTPTPGINYRTIGGILDLYFFLGPTPENSVEQFTEGFGRMPLPSYWSLGFHLCKYGYDTLENMQAAVNRTYFANIPHDVQYGDIDIMDRRLDFTVSQENFGGLPDYVKELKARGVKFITILDPGISIGEPAGTYRAFELGEELDVWTKKADGSNAVAKVWPDDPVYFPDFAKPLAKEYWVTLIKEFHSVLEFDGLWIDMNEPSNFVEGDLNEGCAKNTINNPPYMPSIRGTLSSNTLCPDHVSVAGRHYDTHSLYGWLQSEPTQSGVLAARPGKRGFVLSRSTFIGSGRWTAHWLGDNFSQWNNLHFSIIGMLQFNHFGIPFVGADICGHNGNANADLCQRWHQLGAFYPFSRNHNAIGNIDQDPAVWGTEVAESTRKAFEIRYTFLPHLYTLFYDHLTQGGTVARALWHEFPRDPNTHALDTQFLWGHGFMVSPILIENDLSREIYFPDARWYDYYNGIEVVARNESLLLDSPKDTILLHLRGGFVYPTQDPALNTELSRENPFGLTVALDDADEAMGHMYYDDGDASDSMESGRYYLARYVYQNGELETIVEHDGYPRMSQLKLNTIRLLGSKAVSKAIIDGQDVPIIRSSTGEINLINLNLDPTKSLKIKFLYS